MAGGIRLKTSGAITRKTPFGSTRAVVNQSGEIVEAHDYFPLNPLRSIPDGRTPKVVAIQWKARGVGALVRRTFVRTGPSAGATAVTTPTAIEVAEGLREGMGRADISTGAPPISGNDIGERAVVAPDATGVQVPGFTTLDAPAVDDLGLVLSVPGAKSLAENIAGGHAFGKHVVELGEYPGISTPAEFAEMIAGAISAAIESGTTKDLSGGRVAYWDAGTKTVVIYNPKDPDSGTAFRPTDGQKYFDRLRYNEMKFENFSDSTVTLLISSEELRILHQALNEILYGLGVKEFSARMGTDLKNVESLMAEIGVVLDSIPSRKIDSTGE